MIANKSTSLIGSVPGAGGGAASSAWGSITGTLSDQTDLNNALLGLDQSIISLTANVFESKQKVLAKINTLFSKNPDVVLMTSGVTDLQTAIDALTEGQILEVQTNAVYSPAIIPATKGIIVRAGIGWLPQISGSRCVGLKNLCEDIVISGFIIENASVAGGNQNYQGACITFNDQNAIVKDIIFHNITMKNVSGTASAVMLSYHWSVGGDNYANPPQLSELSDNVAFVDCNIYKGCTDGTEGACINLRAMKNCLVLNCFIDNGNDPGRGMQLQGVLSALIENNRVYNIGGANAEGIKVDQIGTSPFIQTAVIDGNYTEKNIEGIDIDDVVSAIVSNNICRKSSNEGISLDNNSRVIAFGNKVSECLDGIRFEAGSVGYLVNNNSFNNINNNYRMDNGYTPDGSNKSESDLSPVTVLTKNADFIFDNTFDTVLIDTTANNVTGTLPSAALNPGKKYFIKRISAGANTCTINTTSSQTIDGALTLSLVVQYTAVTLISNGSNWFIF